MLTQSQLTDVQFLAIIDNIKTFYNSLKAINFHEDVNIILTEDGFRAIVEEAGYVQASIYVSKECFSEYQFNSDTNITIRINLSVLCDCISCFTGYNSSMKILHKGNGTPLVLLLEQHDSDELITECSIKTKHKIDPMDFSLNDDENNYNFVMMDGVEFAVLFNDINKSAVELELYLSSEEPNMKLTALGGIGSRSNVIVPKTSDMIIKFHCPITTTARYSMSHIRMSLKALYLASKVSLRTDSTGMLGLQIMVMSDPTSPIYIEYFILPLVDD